MSRSVSGAYVRRGPSAVLGLIRASHPEPAVAVTAVSALLAAGAGHHPTGTAIVAATVLASQLAVGWTNDWLDTDRDTAVNRIDKPVVAGLVSRRMVGSAGLLAIVSTPLLAAGLTPAAVACVALALVSALLYNWPLKSTLASVLPYAVSFGALPAFVVLGLPGAPAPPGWLLAAGALIGAGAHFANVLPDLDDDLRTGVRGLPQRIGPAWSRAAAAGLLLAATVTLVFGPPGPPSWSGLAAVGVAAVVLPVGGYASRASGRTRGLTAFRAVMVVAVIDVVLLVLAGPLL